MCVRALGKEKVYRLCRLKGKVNGCFGDPKDVFLFVYEVEPKTD